MDQPIQIESNPVAFFIGVLIVQFFAFLLRLFSFNFIF